LQIDDEEPEKLLRTTWLHKPAGGSLTPHRLFVSTFILSAEHCVPFADVQKFVRRQHSSVSGIN
jgi:hypothetical protein